MKLNFFGKKKQSTSTAPVVIPDESNRLILADMVLNSITDGVIILDENNNVKMINPAAAVLIGLSDPNDASGLDFASVLKFDNNQNSEIPDESNLVFNAIKNNQNLKLRDYTLITAQSKRKPVEITMIPSGREHKEKIITLRDITKELEEEGEQTEFISTASHEMRTPVASIEGYLSLALNEQTATIDERARKYLEEAHKSSRHLGRLFQDLLDTTKLDDKKIKLRMSPVEMVGLVKSIVDGHIPMMQGKNISYTFGTKESGIDPNRRMNQLVYGSVDVDFLREIINNLLENAIKYTAEGGSIWVNVRGDGDRILINVTDTGIGISPDDLKHIFQKFYRVDNSQTRTIGGTGLGLYLVKQRVEAMNGKVWADSSFGEGSTFYLTFPRLTQEEYERRKQIQINQEAMGTAAVKMTQSSSISEQGVDDVVLINQGQSQDSNLAQVQSSQIHNLSSQTDVQVQVDQIQGQEVHGLHTNGAANQAQADQKTVQPSLNSPVAQVQVEQVQSQASTQPQVTNISPVNPAYAQNVVVSQDQVSTPSQITKLDAVPPQINNLKPIQPTMNSTSASKVSDIPVQSSNNFPTSSTQISANPLSLPIQNIANQTTAIISQSSPIPTQANIQSPSIPSQYQVQSINRNPNQAQNLNTQSSNSMNNSQ